MEEPIEAKKLYNKSHGYTDPGQQKDREYKWKFDKDSHVFGKDYPFEMNGAKQSLQNDTLLNDYPQTKIVTKRLEDFRQAHNDLLGRPKFKGTLNPNIKEDYIFGKKSIIGENWNVAKCINGDPKLMNERELKPDKDLGKACKLQVNDKKEENKIFGVPSNRSDLNKKKASIADYSNYGDEKDVYELLYPNQHVFKGLDDEDFEELIGINQLKRMLNERNYNIPEEEIDFICELILKMNPNEKNKITYKSFIDTMRYLKTEYMKYKTLFN
jgi:hypothetical protein